MNKYLNELKNLCSPAFVYFCMSILSIFIIACQNIGNNKKYCIGMIECSVSSTLIVFVFKVLYTLLWTLILNVLCKSGFKELSWFLVLMPFILMFIILGLLFLNKGAIMIK